MGKNIIKLLVVLLLQICIIHESIDVGRSAPVQMEHQSINSKLRPYLEAFERDAARRGVGVNTEIMAVMQFGQLSKEGNVGWCYYSTLENRFNPFLERTSILFIDDSFETISEKPDCLFKALMYHELGHCLLALDHDPKEYWTIMGEWTFPPSGTKYYDQVNQYFCKNWKSLVDDLFLRKIPNKPPRRFKS